MLKRFVTFSNKVSPSCIVASSMVPHSFVNVERRAGFIHTMKRWSPSNGPETSSDAAEFVLLSLTALSLKGRIVRPVATAGTVLKLSLCGVAPYIVSMSVAHAMVSLATSNVSASVALPVARPSVYESLKRLSARRPQGTTLSSDPSVGDSLVSRGSHGPVSSFSASCSVSLRSCCTATLFA